MPRHHRRILFSYDDDHGACEGWYNCASPPSPPPYTLPPTPSPSPSTYWDFPIPPPSPELAPAPSPVRHPAAGRRNQGGTNVYAPPPPAAAATDVHHRRFVTNVLAASAALVFFSLILLGVSVAVRRRNLRRQRRHALLAQPPAATTNVGNDDPEGGGGGGVIHHVWYIRTVGLDQAAIDSIAATRYRAGAGGLLGAADCSVCLGEFGDGELVRLLPKCGHAFHVPCIDTWLRAHVNCPLCRSDVIDPAAAAESGVDSSFSAPADPDANAVAAAEHVAVAIDNSSTPELEDQHQDQEEPHVEEDQHEQDLSSPEPLPQLPCPLPWNVRRAASMDAATVSAAADVAALDRLPEAAPEGEQSHREKDLTGADGHTTSIERLASGGPPRFFFSRHCRARSSVLPL